MIAKWGPILGNPSVMGNFCVKYSTQATFEISVLLSPVSMNYSVTFWTWWEDPHA